MSPPRQSAAISIAYGAAVATMSAIAFALLLSALSTPQGYKERIATLQQKVEGVRRMLKPPAELAPYPADAVCAKGVSPTLDQLRKDIGGQAETAKLVLSQVELGPDEQARLGETLIPLQLKLQAQGSYESTIALLALLARHRPMVFADTVDLSSKTSSVTLKFSGRLFCSAGT